MKKGITMLSLIIYIVCFFTLSVLSIAIFSNLTYKSFSEKSNIAIEEEYIKIYSNFLKSAKNSTTFDVINEKIIFSNGDEYYFENNKIYKNNAILSGDIEQLTIINMNSEIGMHIDTNICLGVKVKFFESNIEKEVYVTVGDNIE